MGNTVENPIAEKGDQTKDDVTTVEGSFADYLRIFRYADSWDWILNGISLVGSIAAGTTMPLMTIVFGKFTTTFNNFSVGQLSESQYQSETKKFILLLIYLFVAKFVLSYAVATCITISGIRTTRAIRQAFLDHLLRFEIWHFDTENNGAAATQVTTNGNRINQGIAEKLGLVVQSFSMFVSAFIIALVVQWKLALITMTIIPVIFMVIGVCVSIDATIEARIVRIYSQGSVLVQEAISSIKTIHAFWAQEKMVKKYDNFLRQAHEEGSKKSSCYGAMYSIEYFCVYSGTALAFWQGHRMFQTGEITNVGTVFTVEMAVLMATTSMSILAPQFTALSSAAAAAAELFRIMDKPSRLDPLDPSGLSPSTCEGNISVSNIDFAYPSRPSVPVLRDFSISIPACKTTALVGESGSGKSTLVGLLERWYLPSSGTITLDGVMLSEYNVKWLRSQVRLVGQEPVLFKGTVFENVAKGFVESQRFLSHNQKMELVQEACRLSNAHEFIKELPQGYHTQVGERASRLSGGQKQRIAIARSIISNPKILLLDEATSALDPMAEGIVQDALDQVSRNRTTIVIAHRLSTIMKADNIAVISEGKIIEQGTHHELVNLKGHYSALVHAQDLGGEDRDTSCSHEKSDGETDEKVSTVMRTKTQQDLENGSTQNQQTAEESMGYSLIRCLYIMFAEQRSLYPILAISAAACLVGGGTYPAQAILFSRVLRVFTLEGSEATAEANFWALMFFVVALANLFAYFILGWLCNIIGQDITHHYRLEMFTRLINLDIEFFDLPHNTSGALTSKLSAMPTQLMELMSMNVFLILVIIVNLVASSVLALVYGWNLSLVVIFGGLVPLVFAGYIRIRLETALDMENGNRFAESAGLASEAVVSIRTVASLTQEGEILNEFSEMLGKIVVRSIRKILWTMMWFSISQSLDFLVMALGFWYGSRLLVSGEYTPTQFYVIFIGVLFAGQAAAQFFGWTSSLTKAVGAANYILWLRTLKPIITETEQNRDLGPEGDDDDISLENLDFKYPQAKNSHVLRNISMTIPSGQFIAVVGASGCGKSTLISLLERYYDPTCGLIRLGKQDITALSPRLYRGNLSLVQQEPTLYEGSIFENIALGLSATPSDDRVLDACRQANVLDFVQSLSEGLSTSCGSRGIQFSGGQRQRVAIARALIRDPRVLLLDEATSSLDTKSERLVQDALRDAARTGGRTTIAVAHRLSTIRDADIIFVLARGEIVEVGKHDELRERRGIYYQMCLAQSLDR
ncbi:P-loop containing nucleoside triphosphate hydrolase protein [Tricladium varicosporioides]|nr:P-loop containing nucleoside triphosphate hydrolase protein [Hymenoscyphus varicosporioides]